MTTVWMFSGLHCDGFEANIVDNCFPAGDTLFADFEFTVKPRSAA